MNTKTKIQTKLEYGSEVTFNVEQKVNVRLSLEGKPTDYTFTNGEKIKSIKLDSENNLIINDTVHDMTDVYDSIDDWIDLELPTSVNDMLRFRDTLPIKRLSENNDIYKLEGLISEMEDVERQIYNLL